MICAIVLLRGDTNMDNNSAAAGDPFAHAGRKKRYKDLEGVDTVVRRTYPELLAATRTQLLEAELANSTPSPVGSTPRNIVRT